MEPDFPTLTSVTLTTRMSDLAALDYVDVQDTHALTAILYGPAKQGKTTGALSAPGRSSTSTRTARAPPGSPAVTTAPTAFREVEFKGRPTMELVERKARTNEEGFKTIVIDTGGRAFDRVMQDVGGLSPRCSTGGRSRPCSSGGSPRCAGPA
jgi:hypothetical protein